MKINGIISTSDFVKEIEKICKNKDVGYIEAIVHYCEMNNIEIETAAGMIKMSRPIKYKIEDEANTLNMLKNKSSKLPI